MPAACSTSAQDRTKAIELRHFRLEKYIDQHLDYSARSGDPARARRLPLGAARSNMIMAPAAGRGSAISTPRPRPTRRPSSRGAGERLRARRRRRRRSRPCSPCSISPGSRGRARRGRRRPSAPGSTPPLAAVARGRAALVAAAVGRLWSSTTRSPGLARPSPAPSAARSQAAYRLYRSQVEAWQQARALTAFTAAWARDLEIAAQRYIEASLEFGQDDGPRGRRQPAAASRSAAAPTAAYRRWLACYAPVLEGQPAARRRPGLRAHAGDALRPQPAPRRLALLGRGAAAQLLFPAAPDRRISGRPGRGSRRRPGRPARPQPSRDLLEEALAPAPVTPATLNATFADRRPTASSPSAAPPTGSTPISACARRSPRARTPPATMRRAPARRSIRPASRRSTTRSSSPGSPCSTRPGVRAAHRRASAAIRPSCAWARSRATRCCSTASARSTAAINGAAPRCPSRAAPPGARAPPPVERRLCVRRGAGPAGFPLYQTAALRRTAFAALFRPFEGAILRRPEMQPPAYPFRPCAGDPLRGPGGRARPRSADGTARRSCVSPGMPSTVIRPLRYDPERQVLDILVHHRPALSLSRRAAGRGRRFPRRVQQGPPFQRPYPRPLRFHRGRREPKPG